MTTEASTTTPLPPPAELSREEGGPLGSMTAGHGGSPPHRRRASWSAVLAIAFVATGVGVVVGSQLRGSKASPASTAAGSGMPGMPGMPAEVPSPPPNAGSSAVYISPGRQQLVGVRTAQIGRQQVEGTVRTVGMLSYDETRTAQIHTRVSGWVEQLYVNYVGKPVRRGQALFSVYSPDLATAQADYLVALHARDKLAENANADIRAGADALLQASRDRMRRWNITDAQIDELERTHKPSRTVAIESPFDGVVLEKDAFAGQYVTPEMTSFKLADLSSVWAVGQVFEYEAARLHVGDTVDVEFPYDQSAKRTGKIDFIYPEVDPQTRRVRFRVTLDNRDRKLKPDTYVTLIWHGEASDRLAIPKEAVIDTGPRKYVLLALADGYFEPRDVQVAPAIGDYYPVVAGVAEGDRVVTSAQFLIDSETNLMAAMQGMSMSMPGMEMGKPNPKATGSGAPTAPANGSTAPMPGMDMPKSTNNTAPSKSPTGSNAAPTSSMPGMPGM